MVATGASETSDGAVTQYGSKEEGWSRVAATSNEAAPTTSGGNTQIAMLVWALSKMRNSESSLHGTANHTQYPQGATWWESTTIHGKGKGVQTAEPHVGAHVLDAGYLCVISSPLHDYHGQPARYESARRHFRDEGQQ